MYHKCQLFKDFIGPEGGKSQFASTRCACASGQAGVIGQGKGGIAKCPSAKEL
jgi:hypothetical protein